MLNHQFSLFQTPLVKTPQWLHNLYSVIICNKQICKKTFDHLVPLPIYLSIQETFLVTTGEIYGLTLVSSKFLHIWLYIYIWVMV